MINLYQGNTEPEQLNILESLSKILKDFQDLSEKNIIFAGDFNLFFDQKLESAGGNLILKELAVSKLLELKESLNCDLGQIRNPKSKAFTFGNVISLELCREDLTIYLKQYAGIS